MLSSIALFDARIEHLAAVHRLPFLNDIFIALTQLGDARIITVVAISIAVLLFRHRRWQYKVGFAVALFGALGASYAIKLLVERPRPPLSLRLINESGYSFPSMHAAVSTAVYGFLIYMIWKLLKPPHHRMPSIITLLVLIFLIDFSRIYLGVHYLSDVIAGAILGSSFVGVGMYITKKLLKSSR